MSTSQGAGSSAERPAAEPDAAPGAELAPAAAGARPQQTAPLTGVPAAPDDLRQLEAQIERTREQLGATVQELAARTDVKTRARAKAAELTGRVKTTTVQARTNAAARAGSVRTQAIGARERWMPLTISAGVLVVGYLALRQWRRHYSNATPARYVAETRRKYPCLPNAPGRGRPGRTRTR